MKNYEYPGAIHIHSTYSDGTSSIEQIAKEAKKAGLKWIVITDHNSIAGLEDGKEGFYEGVCVIVGQEISPDHYDHYMAFGLNEKISEKQEAQDFINEVNEKGGFGFIAHPDEQEVRENEYPALRWRNWEVENFTGLEIWNYMSDWVDTLAPANKFKKFLKPDTTLHGPTEPTLKWWDKLNLYSEKVVPAIFGLDVHCFKYNFKGIPLKVFPYKKSFKTLQNFVQLSDFLSTDFNTAKNQIHEAIKNGNNIMIQNSLGGFAGTVFTATKKNEHGRFFKATAGEVFTIEDDFIIDVETPKVSEIRLYKDGEVVKTEQTKHLKYNTSEPGSYRFESYLEGRYWIMSNPIKVVK